MQDMKEHPAYVYNQIALQLGGFLSGVSSAGVFLLYPAPQNIVIGLAVLMMLFLFLGVRCLLLPRARTSTHLDMIVVGYLFPVFAVQWWCIALTPGQETSTGAACLIVISGILFTSTRVFLAVTFLNAAAWLSFKYRFDGPLTPNEILQLLIVAPASALITRFSVMRTLSVLQGSRLREQQSIQELQTALDQLREETQLRQESEAQLLQARKHESLGVMAAGVAHDFNNTLRAISAVSELIALKSKEEDTRGHADEIVRAVQHASGVCRQMLTYTGRSVVERAVIDLARIVSEIQPLLQVSVGNRVTVGTENRSIAAFVFGNETQVQQVLMNLVRNSADAIQGEGWVTITIANREIQAELPPEEFHWVERPQSGNYVELSISDSGCGMSDAVVHQIFDPYFTTKRTGHGLGLSSVHGIARSHQAALGVSSRTGSGTTLSLFFPTVSPDSQSKVMNVKAIRTPARLSNSKALLVVDDDDLVRTPLVKMLQLLGWEVVEAASGEMAVEFARQRKDFAAILVDYSMSGMNGRETIRAIREIGCESPAILCSGYISNPEDAACEQHFDGFLQKPFRRQELESLLKQLTGH